MVPFARRVFLASAACLLIAAAPSLAQRRGGGGGGGNVSRGSAQTSVNRNNDFNSNRNTNVNANVNRNTNVNVNRDVNVNVHGGGCCYHPVATAAAVTATAAVTAAVVGSVVNTLPPSCSAVMVGGVAYQQCGSTWYQPRFAGTSTTCSPRVASRTKAPR